MRWPGLVLSVVLGAAGGCTLLVDFEDMDASAGDAGAADASRDTRAPPDVADTSPPPDTGATAFPPPCDPDFPLGDVQCNPSFPRPNCARNTTVFPSYPRARGEDLVTCNGSTKPTCVQHCPFGCATMPDGQPDMCDDCDGRKDGTYCMKDLRGADGRNLGLAVECKDGKTAATFVCGTGAGSCATKCPRTDRSPSCCI